MVFKEHDVVAFVGGADVAAAQHTGHLEALLTASHPTIRFRNFGWEGDTVFVQPRDYNFPPLPEHLRKVKATVIFVQFGRMEVFSEEASQFRPAYEKMLDTLGQVAPRLVLVTPIPFEPASDPLPDLSKRNADLAKVSETIKEVAQQRTLPVVDLFAVMRKQNEKITEDGLQLTPRGQGVVAAAFAQEVGALRGPAPKLTQAGPWEDKSLESLRQVIITKNRLWFDYWRPQNWAFLGGDRVEQPSSRDHRNPKVRWFPKEMEMFGPRIAEQEQKISELARVIDRR